MSVLIKDMTLEEFSDYGEYCQTLIGTGQAIELPPHGRLIDADLLEQHILKDWEEYDHWIAVEVEHRPTILEAEEGE